MPQLSWTKHIRLLNNRIRVGTSTLQSYVSPLTEQVIDLPVVTEETVVVDVPVVTEEPVVVDVPVVTDEPVVVDVPVVTEEPVVTE